MTKNLIVVYNKKKMNKLAFVLLLLLNIISNCIFY